MAITINTVLNSGLFTNSATAFQTISESGTSVDISADVSDCKDPIDVIIDIPEGVTGDFEFVCKGEKENKIPLEAGKLNTFRITTLGLKKDDGLADFSLTTTNGNGFANLGVRVAFLKYVRVINH